MTLFIISLTFHVNAQGKGHHKGHHKNHQTSYRGHDDDHEDEDEDDDHHGRHYSDRHRHDRYCHHQPVVVHNHLIHPRYIYYRDYDVYYDYHRNVYISYSGRNWAVSTSIPLALHHVDRRRAVRMAVDYDRDNFTAYLETRRPAYRRVYRGD